MYIFILDTKKIPCILGIKIFRPKWIQLKVKEESILCAEKLFTMRKNFHFQSEILLKRELEMEVLDSLNYFFFFFRNVF